MVAAPGPGVSTFAGYVITWDAVRADGKIFAPGAVLHPEAVVGSVVSSHLNYHQPVGLVTAAENDETGCLVTVHLDFGKGRERAPALVAVVSVKESVLTSTGVERVLASTLLHVSLGS